MKKNLALLALVAVPLLAGCGATGQAAPATAPSVAPAGAVAPSASAPASSAASSNSATSSRGNLIKSVGQPASVTYNDKTVASFVVKSIDVVPSCPSKYAPKPKNGEIVVLSFNVETTADLASTPSKDFSLNIFGWKAIAGNGTTVNGNVVALGCLDSSEQLPGQMGPGEKATGKMAFDVPTGSGTLIYTQPGAPAGWEWNYPAK